MSVLVYQRSDPRHKDWIPLASQQIRLRNLIQILGVNLELSDDESEVYYTLHLKPMSVPFFTSERLQGGRVLTWKEIELRQMPDLIRLSAPGCVIRIWAGSGRPIVTWGVVFNGLHYLGRKWRWKISDFEVNTICFRTPYGFFTALGCLRLQPVVPKRYLQFQMPSNLCRGSYTIKTLLALHRVQRSVLEELDLARKLKADISLYGYSTEVAGSSSFSHSPLHPSLSLRIQQGKTKIRLKEEIEAMKLRVNGLYSEKSRAETRIQRLKKEALGMEDISEDLFSRAHALTKERERFRDMKNKLQDKRQRLSQLLCRLTLRKRQLISELLVIYPMHLVSGAKKYSINEVQLPNAEDYGNEGGGQISVALGYTAHMIAMLSFFLGIPLRYPIRHFGSRTRIVDHITTQIPDKEREFPLYFRGRKDVYSIYAIYLLNKNIAQLRWYCGLSTPDLRATLPNLYDLLATRLIIPGWPPNPVDVLEMAQEITEEIDPLVFKNEFSLSLDGGLDQIGQPPKIADNVWLRSSFSDLECAGANSVPVGEIQHGKAQDRFLNGWKKKTYESEDIDPKWLTNSLNLEFDTGRKYSNPPSPHSSLTSISDDAPNTRKRRFGRVELSNIFGNKGDTLSPGSSDSSSTANGLPANNIVELEKHIKEIERRKSICEITAPGWQEAETTVLPPTILPIPTSQWTAQEEKLDDSIADMVRKISLVEMHLNRIPNRDIALRAGGNEENGNMTDNNGTVLLEDVVENRSETDCKIGDMENINKDHHVQPPIIVSDLSVSDFDTCNVSSEVQENKVELPTVVEEQVSTEQNSSVLDVVTESKVTLIKECSVPEENLVHASHVDEDRAKMLEMEQLLSELNCDKDSGNLENDPSSLWLRTEALLSSQSFNLVKRRVSESN